MAAALNLTTELLLNAWTDATQYVYQRNPIQVTRGRTNQAATLTPSSWTGTVSNRDGRFTIRNPVGAWYGQLVQNTPLRMSVPSSLAGISCYLRMETDQASYASCPDSTALQITSGTLSVRIDCLITDGNEASLMAKWGGTGKSWALFQNSDGSLTFYHFDGTNQFGAPTTLPLPYFGSRIAIRVDYNISAKTITFYTAPSMGGSWTQLVVQTTAATTLSAGTGQPVQIGTSNFAGMYGQVYEAQIYSTATLEADPVFTAQTPGATSFTDAQSNTWTLSGTAELSGRNYRFHGELWSLPKASDPSATDLYATAQAGGIQRRLQQQQTPADSAIKRAYVRLPAADQLAAYWPAEDASGATQIGQAVGQHAMTSAGLTMASSTVFACSAALPVMNGGTATAIVDPSSVSWTDNVVRFLLAVPAADDTNGAIICQFTTQGTVATLALQYAAGGTLTLRGYSAAGAQLFQDGATFVNNPIVGSTVRVSVELLGSGNYNVWVLNPAGTATGFGSTWSGSIGGVTGVAFGGGLVASAMGHFSVQGVTDSINDLSLALNAWNGETAGTRYARLTGEEGYQCRIIGPPSRSQPMGNQTQQTISALLQECETTDQGLQFEPRQQLGLGYITQWALCNQPALVTADYSLSQMMPFSPASDDQYTINDVTLTAADGSTARQVLTTGAMSTAAPPAGIGRFDTEVTVNPQYDSQLPHETGWVLHTRTVDDDRYPDIPFHMSRTETPASVQLADIGSYLTIINTPAWVPPSVKQLVAGYTETFMPQPIWAIDFNGIPEKPYEVATADDLVLGHADTAGATLNGGATYGASTISVATATGPLWTTSAGDYPFNLIIGGMEITVSACSGASSPQTFTVSTWGVNGVQKNLLTGADVRLAHPMILAL